MIVDCETHCESCKYRGYVSINTKLINKVWVKMPMCNYVDIKGHSRLFDEDGKKVVEKGYCDKYEEGDMKCMARGTPVKEVEKRKKKKAE